MEEVLERKKKGDKIILWSCRSGEELSAAVAWCRLHGLEFDAVNENLPEVLEAWDYQDSRKIYADEYWDDKAVRPKNCLTTEQMEEVLEELRFG